MIDPAIELSLRLGLVLLFSVAAWHKVSDHVRFGASLRAYRVLPSSWVGAAAWLLPLAEGATAVALLVQSTRSAGALAAALLLTSYTASIGVNLARGRRDIDCGCFAGSARVPLHNGLIVRNIVLGVAACALLLPVGTRTLIWVDVWTIATVLLTMSLLWAAAQRLAQTGPPLRHWRGAR